MTKAGKRLIKSLEQAGEFAELVSAVERAICPTPDRETRETAYRVLLVLQERGVKLPARLHIVSPPCGQVRG